MAHIEVCGLQTEVGARPSFLNFDLSLTVQVRSMFVILGYMPWITRTCEEVRLIPPAALAHVNVVI